jgi:hypothetical protein
MNERKQRWLSSGFPNHNLHPAAKLLGRLFVLEPNAGRIHSMNTDGSNDRLQRRRRFHRGFGNR